MCFSWKFQTSGRTGPPFGWSHSELNRLSWSMSAFKLGHPHTPFHPYRSTSHIDFSCCLFFFWGCGPLMIPERRPQKAEEKGVGRMNAGRYEVDQDWISEDPNTCHSSAFSPEHKGPSPLWVSPASQLSSRPALSLAPPRKTPAPSTPRMASAWQLFSGSWIVMEHLLHPEILRALRRNVHIYEI